MSRLFHAVIVLGRNEYLYMSILDCMWASLSEWWERVLPIHVWAGIHIWGRTFLAYVARYWSGMHRTHFPRVGQVFLSSRRLYPRNNCPVGQNILGNVFSGHLFLQTDFLRHQDLHAYYFKVEHEVPSRWNRDRLGEFWEGDLRCIVYVCQDVWTNKTPIGANESTPTRLH